MTRLEAPTTLSVPEAIALEKKIHGINPTNKKRGYGVPSLENRRIVEKTNVMINIWLSGLTKAQA